MIHHPMFKVLLSEMETPPNFSYKKEFNTPVLPADHSFADSISTASKLRVREGQGKQGKGQHVLSSSKKVTWAVGGYSSMHYTGSLKTIPLLTR